MNKLVKWKWQIAAPLMGAMLTLAFAPYDYAYAAVLALMLIYRACSLQTVKQAALTGYLFGLGVFGSGVWWVYISIHDFGGADPVSSVLLTALLVAFFSIFAALSTALIARVMLLSNVWSRMFSAALLWVAIEYFRGYWLLNGFPWLQIAYSQLNTPLAGFAPLVGVYGVGFLLVVSASVGVELLQRKLAPVQGFLLLAVIWGGGWWLQTVQWTQPIGEPIKITLIQGNIGQEQKWLPNQKLNTLKLYQQLTEQHWDSDVIIWPETAIPAFLSQVKDF